MSLIAPRSNVEIAERSTTMIVTPPDFSGFAAKIGWGEFFALVSNDQPGVCRTLAKKLAFAHPRLPSDAALQLGNVKRWHESETVSSTVVGKLETKR